MRGSKISLYCFGSLYLRRTGCWSFSYTTLFNSSNVALTLAFHSSSSLLSYYGVHFLDFYTSRADGSETNQVYNYLFSISGYQFVVSKCVSYLVLTWDKHGSLQSRIIQACVFAEMNPSKNIFLEPHK